MGRLRSLAAPVALALALAASAPGANSAGTSCRKACAGVGDAALVQGCDSCATGLIDARDSCLQTALQKYSSCVADCPAFAGFCAITRTCVNHCRQVITGARAACESLFRSRLRRRCVGGRSCLVAARRARRQCLRDCPRAATASPAPTAVDRCACQPRCIGGLVGGCFADCEDRCEGDQTALAICRRGCRDASCSQLMDQCTTEGNHPHGSYERCCMACGNCQADVDCETTTSSTSTTSSTTTASTTTTLAACTALGARCGSCGSGICVEHCAPGGPLVCVVANTNTNACASDAGCAATAPICAGVAASTASCSTQGVGACSVACP
jgi:hypothetical protein